MRPDESWSAAHWCRASGVGRGSLVGVNAQDAAHGFEVLIVTRVGRQLILAAHVCFLYPRGRGGVGGASVDGGADYERAFTYASQLFVPPDELHDAVVAWMERAG